MEKRHLDRRLAQMEAEGTRFRPGVDVGDDVTGRAAARPLRRRRARRRRDRCRATCRARAASSTASCRRWSTCRRPTGAALGEPSRCPPSRRRTASTSSSSAAATPAPTASGTAHRQGAASVTQLEIMPRPPEERPGTPAVADVPDDLPGLQRARGGRRAAVRRQHRRSSSATTQGSVAGAAAGRGASWSTAASPPVEGTEREIPAAPRPARHGLHRPGARAAARAARRRARRAGQRAPRRGLRHHGPRRLRGRRRRPRPVADRLGHRRGPLLRRGRRPLADWRYRAACADRAHRATDRWS